MLGESFLRVCPELVVAGSQGLSALIADNTQLHNLYTWETCFPPRSLSGFI